MPQLKKYRDLSFRIVLIATASILVLYLTQNTNYDTHLILRKKQPVSDKILIVEVADEGKVQNLIRKLLGFSARALILPDSPLLSPPKDSNIFTYTNTSAKNEELVPVRLQVDTDGRVRRFHLQGTQGAQKTFPSLTFSQDYLINFRGEQNTFQLINAQEIGSEMKSFVEDKIVLIKIKRIEEQLITPLGVMSRTEVMANIIDNYFESRFVRKVSNTEQLLICFFILALSLGLLIFLPTSLALASSFLLIIFYVSLSVMLFDKLYLWTPIIAPVLQIFITYILISNYKLILNERTRWKLEKESDFLAEVEEMKTNFLSLFSHDLKTPLAKILAITDTQLSQQNLKPSQKDELIKIRSYCGEIERYFKRILKTAQVESKKISLNKTPTDINKLIEKVIENFTPTAQDKNIQIKTELTPLFLIEMDNNLIQEVIFNLLENALSYSPEGSQVTLRSHEEKDHIKVSVIDQGPGVPVEVQDKVWEKFYRLESKDQGYGLGLYLSKYVIELHNGQVYLKINKGKGSEFGFYLPIEEVDS